MPSPARFWSRVAPPRWTLLLMWFLALAGAAAALTGYLGIDLPGLPARLR